MAKASSDVYAAGTGRLRRAFSALAWLVEPLAAADTRQRRHLQLLAAFLLIMAVNSVIGGFIMAAELGGSTAVGVRLIGLAAGAILLIGYGFSRSRYYSIGTALAVTVPATPLAITILVRSAPTRIALETPWLILPLLVCSLLLSLRLTGIVSLAYLALIFTAAVRAGALPLEITKSLTYIVMIIALVLMVTAIIRQDWRQIELRLREREQAQEALRGSEEKFSSAFKTSPNAICIVSVATGNFIEVNEGFCRFIGYPVEEIVGRNHVELSLWVSDKDMNQMATELQEKGRIYNREFQSRRKSGEIRQGLFSAEVINIAGKPCVIFNITDITERKREEQLQKDENHILTLLSQGTALKDLLNAILRLGEIHDPSTKGSVSLYDPKNKELRWAAGPSLPEDFMRLIADDLIVGEGAGSCGTAAFRKQSVIAPDVASSGLFSPEIVKTMRVNHMLSCWTQPIISSHGELLGTITGYGSRTGEPDASSLNLLEWSARIAAIAIERKHAEDALRQSEEKFTKAFHASPDIIIINRTGDHRFIEVNDSFTRLTGLRHGEILNNPLVIDHLLERLPERERVIGLLTGSRSVRNQEVGFLNRRGEARTLLFSSEPINFGGEPCKVTIAKDITEFKKTENDLKTALSRLENSTAQLKATNRELEAFSYSVSHDLRSPLRSIDGFSQALLEDYGGRLDEGGQDYLRRLRLASQKMGELIDGLLKLSRLTRSEMHPETVDLGTMAREIIARLQETHPEQRVRFSTSGELTARGDPQLLRVLLENLLGNAWKFSSHNPEANIEFGHARTNGISEFFIRDNGAGFDMAYAGKLFAAFQRLHSAEEYPGTGIGLATVQRIINRHGGAIRAEGEVGKGAAFYFTLS